MRVTDNFISEVTVSKTTPETIRELAKGNVGAREVVSLVGSTMEILWHPTIDSKLIHAEPVHYKSKAAAIEAAQAIKREADSLARKLRERQYDPMRAVPGFCLADLKTRTQNTLHPFFDNGDDLFNQDIDAVVEVLRKNGFRRKTPGVGATTWQEIVDNIGEGLAARLG
jgi:hypothetical protein